MTARTTRRILIVLSGALALTTAIAIYTLVREEGTAEKIGPGVKSVGPCRSAVAELGLRRGLLDKECAKQSDYTHWSYCIRHNIDHCPGLPVSLKPMTREAAHERSAKPPRSADSGTGANTEQGGGSSTGAPAPSQPTPPSSGGGGSGGGSTPPPPPSGGNGPVRDVLDTVCRVNALGVRICS